MVSLRNNHVFKGHKTLLGNRYVTYGEVELPTREDIFNSSKDGFDWGYNGSAPIQLSFSILYQLSNEEFAKEFASQFCHEVIKGLNSRDWILSALDVQKWIRENDKNDLSKAHQQNIKASNNEIVSVKKTKKPKTNIVKELCQEIGITQKHLAEILEVPEGTVSSWAVKNEIPRLGKKAIEFYISSKKNQEIVDSYKNFTTLLNQSA